MEFHQAEAPRHLPAGELMKSAVAAAARLHRATAPPSQRPTKAIMLTTLMAVAMLASGRAWGEGTMDTGSVRYLANLRAWVLTTQHTTYAMGLNELDELQTLYWGAKLGGDHDLSPARLNAEHASFDSRETMSNLEYPGWGGRYYNEPALKVTLASGVRDLVLKYAGYEIHGNTLEVRLKDIQYDLFVKLTYKVFPDHDIICKQAEIENRTPEVVTVESAQSGVWYVPAGEGYRLTYLTGRWAGETQLVQETINPGVKVLESRRGNTSHQLNPWFAIDERGQANEEQGRVWFGALGWSGNWKLVVEDTPAARQVRVTGGYNDFDFSWPLQPGQSLRTPPYYGGFSGSGFGGASRLMHRFERDEILPDHAHPHVRPVLYNSWEATTFDVNEPGQKALAEKAAKLGVELFVMDDGWFGKRNDDHAGLGDWYVNPQKFPHGLQPLISYVNGLGMDFGLWFEPEMVNPDSDLYRRHPDWAMNFPGRPRSEARNQLVLNMARDDVKEYIFGVLDKMLSENNIRYIKWDMNRHFGEPGWPELPLAEQKEIWVKYVRNVYEIIDRLRARHPNLDIEACSGGGGRLDLGILERVNIVWTSDNTEALDRLGIQEGFSYAYAPKIMSAWVTDAPNLNGRSTPLQFRFLVAMQGALGIGANLNKWTGEDTALAGRMIGIYKGIRETVQNGDLYRLFSPRQGALTANEYVSVDGKQAVLFAFLHSQQYLRPTPTICLHGLDENATYRMKPIDEKLAEKQESLSGAYLMHHGLNLNLTGDYDSTLVILERNAE